MNYASILDLGGGYKFGIGGVLLIAILAVWELAWKGLGLWKAAKNNHSGWFVAILLFNTLGILPILYIYVFSPKATDKN